MGFTTCLRPAKLHNGLYKSIGAAILVLNKVRYSITGYSTPRPFPSTDYRKAAEYDIVQVEKTLRYLSEYVAGEYTIAGKNILELGPGADLGVGLCFLFKGAAHYSALDVRPLVESVPPRFYDTLLSRLQEMDPARGAEVDQLRSLVDSAYQQDGNRMRYLCRQDFDLSPFSGQSFDLVVSLAAFEHFDDVQHTVSQLCELARSGTKLIAAIDLRTHSRWIRDEDPLNIYRYSDSFYSLCRFQGSPNRLRPHEYRSILRRHGWENIWEKPVKLCEGEYLARTMDSLGVRFRDEHNQMEVLSMVLCATKH
jgi:SAM-dependent methyltransferase